MHLLPFLVEVALRTSLVLSVVFALLMLLKRASAAERHAVLILGLTVVAVIPVGLLVGPKVTWKISLPEQEIRDGAAKKWVMPMSKNRVEMPTVIASSPGMQSFPLVPVMDVAVMVGFLWGMGAMAQMVVLGRAAWVWQRIRSTAIKAHLSANALERAEIFAGTRGMPPVLMSDRIRVPVLLGWLRPVVVLPGKGFCVDEERLAMVLCHELAHFRRGDSRLLPLLALLRVAYWWHPLVWLALACLRREREQACDDLVLAQEFRASDYADLIVQAAREMRISTSVYFGAMAMASSSCVEERVTSILNPALRRKRVGKWSAFFGILGAAILGYFSMATQIQAKDSVAVPAPVSSKSSQPNIELTFRLVSFDEKTYLEHRDAIDAAAIKNDLGFFKNLKGASVMETPSVTTPDGLKANVDILHEFPYATKFDKNKDGKIIPSDFKIRNVGLSIEATPHIENPEAVRVRFTCQIVEFKGWDESSPGIRLPVFDTRRLSIRGWLMGKEGRAFWMGVGGPLQDSVSITPSYLLFITARPVPAESKPLVFPGNQKAMVWVSVKFFQIPEKTYAERPEANENALKRGDVDFFGRYPDATLLANLTVLKKMSEPVTVEQTHRVPFPLSSAHGSPVRDRACGISVQLQTFYTGNGGISLNLFDTMTSYNGLVKRDTGEEEPVFDTSRFNYQTQLSNDKPVGVWVRTNSADMSKIMSWDAKKGTPYSYVQTPSQVRIGMIVRATLCPPGSR